MPDHANYLAMKPKLKKAFDRLKKGGIIARANFSITLSDGIAEIHDPKYRGYAFYHRQDHERARKDGMVTLAYGVFAKKPKANEIVAVGKEVRAALEAAGLHVDWNEDAGSRIDVYLSKAARAKQEKASKAAHEKRERAEKAVRKQLDVAKLDEQMKAAVAALSQHLFWVPHDDYFWKKDEVLARAKKEDKCFAALPLGAPTITDGEVTIFIGSADAEGVFRGRLAIWLKNELKKQGLTRLRVKSGMVMVGVG